MKTCKREDIKDCPEQAEYYLPNKNGTIALFYRMFTEKYNDGVERAGLQYQSFSGTWFYTGELNEEKFIEEKLIKII